MFITNPSAFVAKAGVPITKRSALSTEPPFFSTHLTALRSYSWLSLEISSVIICSSMLSSDRSARSCGSTPQMP